MGEPNLLSHLSENRWGHCSVVYGGQVIVFGGKNNRGSFENKVKALETEKIDRSNGNHNIGI